MTDKELVQELFKRVGVPFEKHKCPPSEDKEVYSLEQGDSPKIGGYGGFMTDFTFQGDTLIEIGAYE